MEAETAAAAARQRREEAEEARAKAAAAREADALAAELAELNRKAEAAADKAKAAREKANKVAENAGLEPPDLEPLACDAMPRRGLARKAHRTPTAKSGLLRKQARLAWQNSEYPLSILLNPQAAAG